LHKIIKIQIFQVDYTDDEIDSLKNLPKKSFILDKNEKFMAYTGLVDILYAYCYNNRVNCGESNSEDGWTIAKLSATLSWFEVSPILELKYNLIIK
jgi:protein SHQ1